MFVKENKVSIIAILERKIKENMENRVVRKIVPGWKFEANHEYSNKGRIWLLWNPQLRECVILNKSEQYIQGRVILRRKSLSFLFVAIYGLHTIQNRKKMWEDLRILTTGVKEHMICIRNYNAILTGDDRVQGSQVHEVEIRDFNEFLLDTGMDELKSTGRIYTWSNGHTCSKIDRAVVNAEWIMQLPHLEVLIIAPASFDHSPPECYP